jgi:hypothetical protein
MSEEEFTKGVMWKKIRKSLKKHLSLVASVMFKEASFEFQQLEIEKLWSRIKLTQVTSEKFSVMNAGYKVYSQTDEDGIIQEIFRRIKTLNKTFIEIGVGDGKENNTIFLLLCDWKGLWIEGSGANSKKCLGIQTKLNASKNEKRLLLVNEMIDINTNFEFLIDFNRTFKTVDNEIDLLSIDIDSHDLEVCKKLLTRINPRVIVIEYNAKFPPPIKISVAKNFSAWESDDYYGSSLQLIVDGLSNYKLVATSISGSNAFFIRQDFSDDFLEVGSVGDLYSPPRFILTKGNKVPGAAPEKWAGGLFG